MNPIVAGAALDAGGKFLGSVFGGDGGKSKDRKEQAREFNLGNWQSAAHSAETSGLRDKLLAMFGQIAQQGPQRFIPRDAFNPVSTMLPGGQGAALAQPQAGGLNPSQLKLPDNYKMGDGGVNPDVYTYLLQRLGYQAPDTPFRMGETARHEADKQKYLQSLQAPQAQPFRGGGKVPYNPNNPLGGGLVNPSGRSY